MNPEEELALLRQLLDELLNGIQDVVLSGEILTDEFQGVLAQELQYLTSRIDELQAQQPIIGQQPPLEQGMPSSNIHSFGYDDKTGKLLVKFQGDYPQENGAVYSYEGIPKVIFDLFQKGAIPARTDGKNRWGRWWRGKSPSLGASLYTLIRNGGYQYQRLG